MYQQLLIWRSLANKENFFCKKIFGRTKPNDGGSIHPCLRTTNKWCDPRVTSASAPLDTSLQPAALNCILPGFIITEGSCNNIKLVRNNPAKICELGR